MWWIHGFHYIKLIHVKNWEFSWSKIRVLTISYDSTFSSVQSLSHVRLLATPWTRAAHQASLSITSSRSLPKLMYMEAVMPSSHLILCRPLLLLCRPLLLLPPIPPSIRVFSNLHMRWPKYRSFSFSIIPSKEIPGLISFRMDWLDLLKVWRLGLPWGFSGYDSELPMQGVQVWSLVRELDPTCCN